MPLKDKKCIPCEGKVKPYTKDEAEKLLPEVKGWALVTSEPVFKITRSIFFKDFRSALMFANEVGDVAEFEGHHPDILIHHWNQMLLSFSTHAIKGLSENDFIMAAKINQLIADNELEPTKF